MAKQGEAHVTDTELAMLEVLWERGEATRREIADVRYPGGGESHYATVQNLLGRLEKKRFARHTKRGGVLVFRATIGRDELIRRRLQGVADALCGGAVAPLLMNLLRTGPLSPDDVEQLATFVRESKRNLASKPR